MNSGRTSSVSPIPYGPRRPARSVIAPVPTTAHRVRRPVCCSLAPRARNVKPSLGDLGTGYIMCRWIAYRGETIALEQYVTAPAHSLVVQSVKALESTASTNGDGFGLGWYGEHPEPGLYREVRPAWSDENLRYLCRHINSHLYFAHVRASTGTPVTRPNCHPFACGRWLFMHNGLIGNWTRLRRKVEALIPDEFYGSRIGTTDSEAVFLAILGAGADKDPVGATLRVLTQLTEIVSQKG